VTGSSAPTTTSSGPPKPVLKLITTGAQPVINSRILLIKTTCGDASCLVTANAELKLPGSRHTWQLKGTAATIAAGEKGAVQIPVPSSLRRAVRAYLKRHPHYRPKLTVQVALILNGHVTQTATETLSVWTLPGFR
jgi:hypothetical protein